MLAKKPSKIILNHLKNLKELQEQDPHIIKNKDKYVLKNNLYHIQRKSGATKLILPESITPLLAEEIHCIYGHIGSRKIMKMMQEDFVARRLKDISLSVTKNCLDCQKNKWDTQKHPTTFQPIITNKPGEIL